MPRRPALPHLPNDERKLLIEATAAWRKSNVVITSQKTSIKTYRTTEPCSTDAKQLASLRVQSSIGPDCPDKMGEERQVHIVNKRIKGLLTPCSPEHQTVFTSPIPTLEDVTGQGFVNEQAQAPSSILLGEMGEERREYSVVSKIIRAAVTARSPEGSMVLTQSIPSSPPPPLSPHHLFDEFSRMPTTKQCNDIVISKNEEADASKYMPEARTAPARFPAPPTQTSAPCQSLDSSLPPTDMQPRQDGLCAISLRYSPNDTCSLMLGTARKQSEPFKTPPREREGVYLERAAAYVQERMKARHPLDYDMLVLRARQDPPDSSVDADTRQPSQKVANERTSHIALHSPYATAVLMLAIAKPILPSTSVSPASPSNGLISNGDQSTTLSMVKNDIYKAEVKACCRTLDATNEGNEMNGTRSLEPLTTQTSP
ncbi:hypothetical protein AX14_008297 [Amanita brunnescens Koide BX004]|nr:hypothetical protein AX14_008297 [Amanita brunnescens Koide BX004]